MSRLSISTLSRSSCVFSLSVLFAVVGAMPIQRRDGPQTGDVLEPIETQAGEAKEKEEDTKEKGTPTYKYAVLGVVGFFVLLAVIFSVFWCVRRSNKRAAISKQQEAAAAAKYAADNSVASAGGEHHDEVTELKQPAAAASSCGTKGAYVKLSGSDDHDDLAYSGAGERYEQVRSRSRIPAAAQQGPYTVPESDIADSAATTWKPYRPALDQNPPPPPPPPPSKAQTFEEVTQTRSSSMYSESSPPLYGDIPPVPAVPSPHAWKAYQPETTNRDTTTPEPLFSTAPASQTTYQPYTSYSAYKPNSTPTRIPSPPTTSNTLTKSTLPPSPPRVTSYAPYRPERLSQIAGMSTPFVLVTPPTHVSVEACAELVSVTPPPSPSPPPSQPQAELISSTSVSGSEIVVEIIAVKDDENSVESGSNSNTPPPTPEHWKVNSPFHLSN